jgi:hypothetical protein
MTILVSESATHPDWNKFAGELLLEFVKQMQVLYGRQFLVYNVHSLIHLHCDAKNFGSLDNVSAFPFENYMQSLKRMLRAKNAPLQQVIGRVLEKESEESTLTINPSTECKLIEQCGRVSVLCNGIKVSNSRGDNCFRTMNGRVILINDIITRSKKLFVKGHEFESTEDLPDFPCPSSKLDIFAVKNLSKEICTVRLDELITKCVLLPVDAEEHLTYYCFPYSHKMKF